MHVGKLTRARFSGEPNWNPLGPGEQSPGLFAGILHGAYELSCNPFENQIAVKSRIETNEIATALRACGSFGGAGFDQKRPRLELHGLSFDLNDHAVTVRVPLAALFLSLIA